MLRNASIAVLALILSAPAAAQTSKRPGAPIRVMLDDPKPAAPAAAAPATPPAKAPAATAAPAKAVQAGPKTSPAPAPKAAAEPKRAEPPKPVAKPKPPAPPKVRAKPKKLPPFPKMERGKPESYRRAIEAWRDLLEEQRVARGGGRYPSYTQALSKYQQGVDRYFLATGRTRDKSETAEPEKKAE